MKPKKAKDYDPDFEQCLMCKKITDSRAVSAAITSDGEVVCGECCDWFIEEGRKSNEF